MTDATPMLEWVYYVPEFEAICIVRPEYRDDNGNTPIEWDYYDLVKLPMDFNFKVGVDAFFLGEL